MNVVLPTRVPIMMFIREVELAIEINRARLPENAIDIVQRKKALIMHIAYLGNNEELLQRLYDGEVFEDKQAREMENTIFNIMDEISDIFEVYLS